MLHYTPHTTPHISADQFMSGASPLQLFFFFVSILHAFFFAFLAYTCLKLSGKLACCTVRAKRASGGRLVLAWDTSRAGPTVRAAVACVAPTARGRPARYGRVGVRRTCCAHRGR